MREGGDSLQVSLPGQTTFRTHEVNNSKGGSLSEDQIYT